MNVAGYRGRIAIAVAAITVAVGTGAWLRASELEAVRDRTDTERSYPPCPDRPEYWTPRTELGPRESTASNIRDVDGDGHNDVLFTNTLDETVTIWWGTGRTHPTERTDVPIGRSGGAVAVEDVNNDGLRDLVGNMPDEAAIAEVLATGLRTFGAPRRHLQGPSGHDLMLVPTWPGQAGPQLLFRIPGLCVATRTRLDTGTWLPHTCISGPADVLSYGVADTKTILAKRGPRWFRVTDGTARPEADDAAVVLNDVGGVRFLGIGADLVRVNVDGSRCQWATPTGIMAPAIGDLDGDRRPDVVGTRTCQGCTSNHVFLYSSAAI
jgi:hypothetical protein